MRKTKHLQIEHLNLLENILVGTSKEDMIIQTDLLLDCSADADFSGVWSYANRHNRSSAKSRAGFVITLESAPILWVGCEIAPLQLLKNTLP